MKQPWFKPTLTKKDETIVCWENTVLFTVSCFQYVILACVYSKGKPYRQSILYNFWLLMIAVILSSFVVYLIVYPDERVAKFLEILPLKHTHMQLIFRYSLLSLPMIHLLLALIVEVSNVELFNMHFIYIFLLKKLYCITFCYCYSELCHGLFLCVF